MIRTRKPHMHFLRSLALLLPLALTGSAALGDGETAPARDPKQPVDEAYTAKIQKYTTQPFFTSPLVDYLPASKNVPTPEAVLGDVAGAPGILPYAEDVYKYMRLLEKASPRVKVFSIGKTEEGREMIAVAVSSPENLKNLDENRARLAKLADPRTIKLDDAEADKIVAQAVPVYYITGTIHSPETGAPTALMELAYRLAVDESPYIREIRDGMITLITPVVEVDGRDRMVDIYHWHLAHPKDFYPPLIYWGKYVAHDNNRDAMGVTLKLTENVLNTYVDWKAQVLHDLHESVPYLYDNTAGDGPFNAWVDPILTDEWEMIGWRNVADMTKFGMPGVFTHGDLRHLVAGLSDVYRGDAQRHQPAVRNVRQRRRGHARAHARPGGVCAHLVPAESAAPEDALVAAGQQQLRTDRFAHLTALFQREQAALSEEFLSEGETLGHQARRGRARSVRLACRRSAGGLTSRVAARPAKAGGGDFARDVGFHSGAAGKESSESRKRKRKIRQRQGSGSRSYNARISRRQLHHPHGPAVLAHRRRAARLSVLESGRSAENSVRRYRLDVWRTVRRASNARHRSESSGCCHGARERNSRAGRRAAAKARFSRSTTTPSPRWPRCDTNCETLSIEAAEEPFESGGKKFNSRNVSPSQCKQSAADRRHCRTGVAGSIASPRCHP